jgi:hypothetical protein
MGRSLAESKRRPSEYYNSTGKVLQINPCASRALAVSILRPRLAKSTNSHSHSLHGMATALTESQSPMLTLSPHMPASYMAMPASLSLCLILLSSVVFQLSAHLRASRVTLFFAWWFCCSFRLSAPCFSVIVSRAPVCTCTSVRSSAVKHFFLYSDSPVVLYCGHN